jgi:asparagine synthase (glutamine-hydrolysing)
MCGIVAVTSDVDLAPALRALAHRGPDGSGTWRAPGIALGHTRLAVVDPAHGAQPIVSADGSIICVVNGEIYDTFDIPLRTRCDSELVIHLYERYGDAFVEKIRGELAFVLWDAKRRRLVAGRDRFGIKPLVWARHAGGIALASEAKALFALGVPARWDAESWFHAAHTQYTWPDRTLFEGVHQLEPGCVLVYDGEVSIRRYYDRPEVAGDLRGALEEAVRLRLRADANVCVQLSGGLDSTTIAAIARVPAFTVAFTGGGDYDERAIAERTARELELPLTIVEVDAQAIATQWPDAVAHGEGLAINGHLVGKYLLSRAMRDAGFKVALTGEGADELFAGYPHLRQDAGIVPEGHAASRGVMLPAGDALSTEGVRARLGFVPTWIAAKASLGARVRPLLAPDLVHAHADPYGTLIDRLGPLPAAHVSAASWMKTALAGYILRTLGDGMEMRHGIEGRVPFLDHHVAECAFAIENHVDPHIDKPVLRAAVAGLVPAHVRMRPKHPFLAPPLSRLAPALVQDTLRTHARRSSLVDGPALVGILDRLPAMSIAEQQQWDPALMLVLSGAILEARYCQ